MFATSSRFHSVIEKLSYVFLIIGVFATPFFIDKKLINYFVVPKQYIFIGITLLSLLCLAIRTILLKQIKIRQTIIDLPVLAILGAAIFSAIFSVSGFESFLGRNEYFVINLVYLIFLIIFYFLLTNNLTSYARWQTIFDVLAGAIGISAV